MKYIFLGLVIFVVVRLLYLGAIADYEARFQREELATLEKNLAEAVADRREYLYGILMCMQGVPIHIYINDDIYTWVHCYPQPNKKRKLER